MLWCAVLGIKRGVAERCSTEVQKSHPSLCLQLTLTLFLTADATSVAQRVVALDSSYNSLRPLPNQHSEIASLKLQIVGVHAECAIPLIKLHLK